MYETADDQALNQLFMFRAAAAVFHLVFSYQNYMRDYANINELPDYLNESLCHNNGSDQQACLCGQRQCKWKDHK